MSFVPKEYPLVLAGLSLTGVTVTAILFAGAANRKKANVNYPAVYADDAEARVDKEKYAFNCAQRGAYCVAETYPQSALWIATAGLVLPRTAAGLAVVYSVGAFAFARAYKNGPDSRYHGVAPIFRLSQLAAIATAGYASFVLVTEALK